MLTFRIVTYTIKMYPVISSWKPTFVDAFESKKKPNC